MSRSQPLTSALRPIPVLVFELVLMKTKISKTTAWLSFVGLGVMVQLDRFRTFVARPKQLQESIRGHRLTIHNTPIVLFTKSHRTSFSMHITQSTGIHGAKRHLRRRARKTSRFSFP
jgi:hypothetical protein